jgi:hypothetical protein
MGDTGGNRHVVETTPTGTGNVQAQCVTFGRGLTVPIGKAGNNDQIVSDNATLRFGNRVRVSRTRRPITDELEIRRRNI